ncbi:hypothetical protein GCM10025876_27480 [Demequina litorisediminis]|uniref:Uncharacterized protein n=1 Tax=Demequina litorisediminis TaxID=1849022 RepID=A0ABQ6IFM9_9MICO|nr:hypothetical protein GCM10025876_27480 [Demequina litorisediminis]
MEPGARIKRDGAVAVVGDRAAGAGVGPDVRAEPALDGDGHVDLGRGPRRRVFASVGDDARLVGSAGGQTGEVGTSARHAGNGLDEASSPVDLDGVGLGLLHCGPVEGHRGAAGCDRRGERAGDLGGRQGQGERGRGHRIGHERVWLPRAGECHLHRVGARGRGREGEAGRCPVGRVEGTVNDGARRVHQGGAGEVGAVGADEARGGDEQAGRVVGVEHDGVDNRCNDVGPRGAVHRRIGAEPAGSTR